jgi:hypothetical protein
MLTVGQHKRNRLMPYRNMVSSALDWPESAKGTMVTMVMVVPTGKRVP